MQMEFSTAHASMRGIDPMNTRAFVILILAIICASQTANGIEIGLIQKYGGCYNNYIYNSTVVLCDGIGTGCNEYDEYFCPAIGRYLECGKTIAVTDPPGSKLCDPPEYDDGESCDGGYYCDKLDAWVSCDIIPVVPENGSFEGWELEDQISSNECLKLPAPMVIVPNLGSGTFKPPEPASLINTSQWGEVPANQILVVAKDDCCCCLVESLAKSLRGSIVGYIDFINLFQIETPGKSEADLRDAIDKAKANPCIKSAFAHQEIFPDISPLDDPVYVDGGNRSFWIAGVPQAWDEIRGSGLDLSPAKIGIVDDGLYKGYGEFDGPVRIDTRGNGSLLERPSSEYKIAGSHGTGIMNIIAADPDNGGLVGIASEPLRNNLTVTMINMLSPMYSKSGDAWYMGYMLALCKAGVGSDLLSLSWGNSEADPAAVDASKEFFNEWEETNPDHLFVCSAGNDGKAMDGSRRFPYTYHMPNVITVGCINNDGTLNKKSNRISESFEVTLGVPGDQVIWGRDSGGRIENSGGLTSMSVPFVTSTAALIRSIDPGLNASSIKTLLVETARQNIELEGNQVPAPAEVGGGILAADLAVQRVMANLRNSTQALA